MRKRIRDMSKDEIKALIHELLDNYTVPMIAIDRSIRIRDLDQDDIHELMLSQTKDVT